MLTYTAAYFHRPETGRYVAEVLDFPGVLSQGKDLEKARRMLCDALREMSELYLEQGRPLPRPDPTRTDKEAAVIEPITLTATA